MLGRTMTIICVSGLAALVLAACGESRKGSASTSGGSPATTPPGGRVVEKAAVTETEYALALDPNNWIARTNLAKIAEAQHRYKDALVGLETASRSAGTSLEPLAFIGHVYAVEGHRTEAVQVLSRLEEMSTRRYVPASKIAMIYAGLNQPDQAISWLRKACTERDLFLIFLNVNPRWDPLRSDLRFGEIERCVGLPSLVPLAAVRPGKGIAR